LHLACGFTVDTPQTTGDFVPVAPKQKDASKFVAGAVHTTFGVALLLGNSSEFLATLLAMSVAASATLISFRIGGYACSRAYARITEAIGL
jgi:hypothetical protein